MARVTVEDCAEVVENRFALVIYAASRAEEIHKGAPLTIDRDKDKDHVISLREIAKRTINVDVVRENVIQKLQKKARFDDNEAEQTSDTSEEDLLAMDMVSQEISSFSVEEDFGDDFSFVDDNMDDIED
jgi:DNA-directed RNA polymerase subunit omega